MLQVKLTFPISKSSMPQYTRQKGLPLPQPRHSKPHSLKTAWNGRAGLRVSFILIAVSPPNPPAAQGSPSFVRLYWPEGATLPKHSHPFPLVLFLICYPPGAHTVFHLFGWQPFARIKLHESWSSLFHPSAQEDISTQHTLTDYLNEWMNEWTNAVAKRQSSDSLKG